MLMYHCKFDLGIMSFNLGELTLLLLSGWLDVATQCIAGAFI